jgi:hypothetical protein
MQFAKPEISGLTALMAQLRAAVKASGPFNFIKLTHHASYNGFDNSLLQDWSPASHFAHTGGLNDPAHPDPTVLQLLDENRQRLQWARTDRNGLITVTFSQDTPQFEIAFGGLNDPTPNADEASVPVPLSTVTSNPVVMTRRILSQGADLTATAKVGPDVARVSVTFEIERSAGPQPPDVPRPAQLRRATGGVPIPPRPIVTGPLKLRLASGRALPKLLFVTNSSRLINNIGSTEAAAAIKLIQDAGQQVYDVLTPASPWTEIRTQLANGEFKGIIIVGGFDVLPATRLDVLPPSLRSQVGSASDSDNFIVWNDEAYGAKNGDLSAELPVSRIPDAKSPRLVMNALTAGAPAATKGRFGVRNSARPFAIGPYSLLQGRASLLVSAPTKPSSLGAGNASGDVVYFMLHGSDVD